MDNLFFTALICYLSYSIVREKAKKCRIIVASIIGTIGALFYPFISSNFIFLYKLILFVVMCLILYLKLPKFFLHGMVFLLSTSIVGGIQFILAYTIYGNLNDALRLPISQLPLSVFFLPPLILFLVAKKLFFYINAHRLKQNYIYDMKLSIGNKSKELRGLIDTGNNVRSKNDVVFINDLIALELLGFEFFSVKEADKASSMIIHTATGNKKIFLLPGKIELYLSEDEHIFMDVQVGIGEIKPSSEFEVILPLSILGKEKVA